MADPVVIHTDYGSIELTASAGDCIVEGCRMKGGNMARFIVHHRDYERPQGFKVCGRHFALAVGQMMDDHLRRSERAKASQTTPQEATSTPARSLESSHGRAA